MASAFLGIIAQIMVLAEEFLPIVYGAALGALAAARGLAEAAGNNAASAASAASAARESFRLVLE